MKPERSLILVLSAVHVFTVIFAASVHAQSRSSLAAQIRDSVEAWRARNPGIAVSVYRRGTVILNEGYGTTQLGSTRSVTARTIFHLASVTKPFVAMAVMQLVERGKVNWS